MQTWQDKMPDYKLVLWDKNKFDTNSVAFVREACAVKKWAFAADYIRAYALYTEGGIYLDTDVIVRKSFAEFLKYDFFTAVEYSPNVVKKANSLARLNADGTPKVPIDGDNASGIALQAAIMGGRAGHPYLQDCLNWYAGKHFILPDGSYNMQPIAPAIYANLAQKYGFRYRNDFQRLAENMVIFPSYVLATNRAEASPESYAVHCCNDGWRSWQYRLYLKLARNNLVRRLTGRKPLASINDIIANKH
ncbi:mannosyltransferase OCH1 [Candidatus Termititenax aidoneus]|uniref:Mannosyltransferase OCH1 n=1 Tax=Termititenax aidoneus TaxID=2218524 RepID=A0A388T8F7_TERA1|nr:mannosyltransferase OCH1 [Candidatus Termititenax aidoneus]